MSGKHFSDTSDWAYEKSPPRKAPKSSEGRFGSIKFSSDILNIPAGSRLELNNSIRFSTQPRGSQMSSSFTSASLAARNTALIQALAAARSEITGLRKSLHHLNIEAISRKFTVKLSLQDKYTQTDDTQTSLVHRAQLPSAVNYDSPRRERSFSRPIESASIERVSSSLTQNMMIEDKKELSNNDTEQELSPKLSIESLHITRSQDPNMKYRHIANAQSNFRELMNSSISPSKVKTLSPKQTSSISGSKTSSINLNARQTNKSAQSNLSGLSGLFLNMPSQTTTAQIEEIKGELISDNSTYEESILSPISSRNLLKSKHPLTTNMEVSPEQSTQVKKSPAKDLKLESFRADETNEVGGTTIFKMRQQISDLKRFKDHSKISLSSVSNIGDIQQCRIQSNIVQSDSNSILEKQFRERTGLQSPSFKGAIGRKATSYQFFKNL